MSWDVQQLEQKFQANRSSSKTFSSILSLLTWRSHFAAHLILLGRALSYTRIAFLNAILIYYNWCLYVSNDQTNCFLWHLTWARKKESSIDPIMWTECDRATKCATNEFDLDPEISTSRQFKSPFKPNYEGNHNGNAKPLTIGHWLQKNECHRNFPRISRPHVTFLAKRFVFSSTKSQSRECFYVFQLNKMRIWYHHWTPIQFDNMSWHLSAGFRLWFKHFRHLTCQNIDRCDEIPNSAFRLMSCIISVAVWN